MSTAALPASTQPAQRGPTGGRTAAGPRQAAPGSESAKATWSLLDGDVHPSSESPGPKPDRVYN